MHKERPRVQKVQIMFVDEQTLVRWWELLCHVNMYHQTHRVHQFLDKGNGLVAERHLPKGSIVFTEVCVCVCVCQIACDPSGECLLRKWNCVLDCFENVAMSILCGKKKFRKLNLDMLCMSVAVAVLSVCLPVYIHSRALYCSRALALSQKPAISFGISDKPHCHNCFRSMGILFYMTTRKQGSIMHERTLNGGT